MAIIHTIDHPQVRGARFGSVKRNGKYNLLTSCILYQLGDTTIDTAPPREWAGVKAFLSGHTIRQVALTHHHEDHSGNGHNFQTHFDARIYSHPNNHAMLSKGLRLSPIRRATFGNVQAFDPVELPEKIETSSGHTLKPVHMPGHCNDLVCYLEPNEGWLFTGDLYVASRLKYMTIAEDFGDWIRSLKLALSLDFETVFCAHRAEVKNGKEVLAKKLAFFEETQARVKELHQHGYSARRIRKRLFGNEDVMSLMSGFHMSKQKIIDSCLESL